MRGITFELFNQTSQVLEIKSLALRRLELHFEQLLSPCLLLNSVIQSFLHKTSINFLSFLQNILNARMSYVARNRTEGQTTKALGLVHSAIDAF